MVNQMDNTYSIDIGASEDLAVTNPEALDFNFVLVHRHYDPLAQWWGNFCSGIVSKIAIRSDDGLPIRWYHEQLFNFCYKQYNKYGDYYRILDNSFGKAGDDELYEVR